jgi:hypothetical protein
MEQIRSWDANSRSDSNKFQPFPEHEDSLQSSQHLAN